MSSLLSSISSDALLTAFLAAATVTPLAHLAGVALCHPGSAAPRRHRVHGPRLHGPRVEIQFLLGGGSRHLVLQALSLTLWLCAVLVAVPVLHMRWQQHAPHPGHLYLLSAAIAVVAFCSLLFQAKALLVFEPSQPPPLLGRAFLAGTRGLAWDVSRLPSATARSYIVTGLGLLWVGLGGALLLATEFLTDRVSLTVYYSMAAACVTTGAFTTHGLAGFLRHSRGGATIGGGGGSNGIASWGDPAGSSGGAGKGKGAGSSEWHFWQPFQGGTAFVLAQALGWALYSSALVAIIYLFSQAVMGVAYCVRCWAVAAGAIMFTSELLLAGSLLAFQAPRAISVAKAARSPSAAAREHLANLLVLAMLYIPMHIFCASAALTFMVLPPAHATALWAGGLFVYYSVTAFGQPEHTGRREWPFLQRWLGEQLECFLPAWLGSLNVVLHGGKAASDKFDPSKKYVFGFHHHGLYPLSAGYLPLLPSFRSLIPVRPVVLTASVCVVVPLLRDIMLWLGARVVSRRTFEHTLNERRAVLICPGGQAEMCLTNELHRHKQFTVFSGHKGFVRLALKHGAALVPVLSLGEADSLRNMIVWPSMQRWCTKKLGFPIPFVIVGRWWLPLPARTHLKFVVGQPIEAPPPAVEGQPSQAEVDALHARFYEALRELWAEHAPSFPGYADVELVVQEKDPMLA